MTTACLKCGKLIDSNAATGRPKSYCSIGCRRLAEFEIRRLAQFLAKHEEQWRLARWDRFGCADVLGRTREQQIEDLERALRDAESRLKALLDSGETHAESDGF
ncbi:MAG: hypothetical protein ACREV9_16870 [Burkholderiales bacterium]